MKPHEREALVGSSSGGEVLILFPARLLGEEKQLPF